MSGIQPEQPTPSNNDVSVCKQLDLTGRRALITGATGYLGRAMAQALAEAGATVVAASRVLARAEQVARELPRPGGTPHHAVELDQMNEGSLDRGFHRAVGLAGGLDVLVNNGHEQTQKDWRDVTGDEFSRQLANATGYFLLARLMHQHTVERQGLHAPDNRASTAANGAGSASIIMLGSMYGLVGSYPEAYTGISAGSPVAYHTLKGGIVHLTRHLAVYWAKDGVRVNCLSPGPFPKPSAPAELIERLRRHSPLGRIGQPHELGGAVVFLAGDASSYMTGQNLVIDGGWTAW